MFGKLIIDKTETPIRRRALRVVCAALLCGLVLGICAPALAQTFVTFDAPDARTGEDRGTLGQSINLRGEVTGYFQDANDVVHGFVRNPGGRLTEFDAPGASTRFDRGTVPLSINRSGAERLPGTTTTTIFCLTAFCGPRTAH